MDKKRLRKTDRSLLFCAFVLIALGFLLIFSATQREASREFGDGTYFLKRQMLSFFVGLVLSAVVFFTDYSSLEDMDKIFYGVNVLLLVVVLFFGRVSGGAQRWISLGLFDVQPSEFAKFFIILTLASYFSRRDKLVDTFTTYVFSLAHILPPLFFIFMQPDLGTSLTFIAIWTGMSLAAGVRLRYVAGTLGAGMALLPILWQFLKDYQKKRLLVFLDPNVDPLGAGYHLIQSKIAIGSGGFFGKGWLSGPQSQLNFIPGQHTDFIFTLLGEEFGFVGALIFLAFFGAIIFKGFACAQNAKEPYGALIAVGAVSMLLFHLVVNVGMTIGFMPITGIPLSFLSFGGSSLVMSMMVVALIANIDARRQKLVF